VVNCFNVHTEHLTGIFIEFDTNVTAQIQHFRKVKQKIPCLSVVKSKKNTIDLSVESVLKYVQRAASGRKCNGRRSRGLLLRADNTGKST